MYFISTFTFLFLSLDPHGIIPRHRPSVLPGCCTIAESSCNDVPAVRSRERRDGTIRATKRSASPARRRRRKGQRERDPAEGGREWDGAIEGEAESPKDSNISDVISEANRTQRTQLLGIFAIPGCMEIDTGERRSSLFRLSSFDCIWLALFSIFIFNSVYISLLLSLLSRARIFIIYDTIYYLKSLYNFENLFRIILSVLEYIISITFWHLVCMIYSINLLSLYPWLVRCALYKAIRYSFDSLYSAGDVLNRRPSERLNTL